MDKPIDFAMIVRVEMARIDMKAGTLAEAARISPTVLSRQLRGLSPFGPGELQRIADTLGVSVGVLEGTEEAPAAKMRLLLR